jgi:hypothetical protein
MKIIDQTKPRGRHSVLLMAESADDEKLVRRVAQALRDLPGTLAGRFEQDVNDRFPSLVLEEIDFSASVTSASGERVASWSCAPSDERSVPPASTSLPLPE